MRSPPFLVAEETVGFSMGPRADGKMAEASAVQAYVGPILYKALSNPLRHQIIMRTGERPWSPKEIADDLEGVNLKRVCEQIEVLLEMEPPLLELVDEYSGPRGSTIHLYRALIRARLNHADWASFPPAEQLAQTVTITEQLHKEWIGSINAGLFHSDPNHVLMRTPLNLDREGTSGSTEFSSRPRNSLPRSSAKVRNAARRPARCPLG
jgi:hypothetical protein